MKVRGLSELLAELNRLPDQAEAEAKQLAETYGRLTLTGAQRRAPVDLGKLRQSGSYESSRRGLGAKVTFSAPYAAFVEFGTGGLVSVPEGWEDLASGYKGKGKRQINRAPHPYLIPVFLINADKYYQNLDKMLSRLLR